MAAQLIPDTAVAATAMTPRECSGSPPLAAPFLIVNAAKAGGAPDIVGAAIFSASLILLYLTSTLYHAARRVPTRQLLVGTRSLADRHESLLRH